VFQGWTGYPRHSHPRPHHYILLVIAQVSYGVPPPHSRAAPRECISPRRLNGMAAICQRWVTLGRWGMNTVPRGGDPKECDQSTCPSDKMSSRSTEFIRTIWTNCRLTESEGLPRKSATASRSGRASFAVGHHSPGLIAINTVEFIDCFTPDSWRKILIPSPHQ